MHDSVPSVSLAFLLCTVTLLPAQDWSLSSVSPSPAATTFPRMVYDSQRARCVEFGGWNAPFGSIVFDDTWEYDGTAWQLRAPATVPDERDSHVMAYDSARGRTVMFGGWDFNFVLLGQTWEWDGTDWVDRMPAHAPSARKLAAATYDAGRGVVVLFGGEDLNGFHNDTWEWDGTDWTQVATMNAPSARISHTITYDLARARIVLFGGNAGSGPLGDTWEYDGTDWVQVVTDGSPPARVDAQLAYDVQRARCVLFGGADVLVERNDTWEYDGARWRELFTVNQPPPNSAMAIAYDLARGRTVVFGGFDGFGAIGATWELGGIAATYRTFGTGCIGSNGLAPRLAPIAMPTLGTTTRVDVADLPMGGGVVYLAGGLSDQTWLGAPLPVDLSPAGLTGCRGYTSAEAGALLAHTNGTAVWTLAVPASPMLSGFTMYLQALSFDAGVMRPFAAAMSGAAELNVR